MPRGLELLIAQTILQGFDAQYGRFLEVTSGAQQRLAFDSYKSEAKKSAYSTVRQRHFLRRFNHHRAKLGHTVIGNT